MEKLNQNKKMIHQWSGLINIPITLVKIVMLYYQF